MSIVKTQILLKEDQHRFLQEEARLKNVSISEVIRELIEEKRKQMSLSQVKGALEMANGAIAGPADSFHHDKVLHR
ncbi:MAG: hypothetical protein STSR0004_17360 [Peptococcaceae bacterium]